MLSFVVTLAAPVLSGRPAPAAAAPAPDAAAPAPDAARLRALPGDLEKLGREHDLPGFVAYAFEGFKPVFYVASGARRRGGPADVRHDDRFHLGSCGKAITAVIAARLVDREVLSWRLPLRLAFDDVHPQLADVTLSDLLLHRAGLVQEFTRTPHWKTAWRASGSPAEVRQKIATRLVAEAPELPPRTAFAYSNASYLVAGAILERATGDAWEELVREHVFNPLGMSSCGFGPPAANGPAPWGHRETDAGLEPVPPGPAADNPPAMGPAGTVHCSAEDWGRFVMTFAASVRGESDYLSAASVRALTALPPEGDAVMGWVKVRRGWSDGFVFNHDRSAVPLAPSLHRPARPPLKPSLHNCGAYAPSLGLGSIQQPLLGWSSGRTGRWGLQHHELFCIRLSRPLSPRQRGRVRSRRDAARDPGAVRGHRSGTASW